MDDIDQIKQKIDIVELINEYVPLKKAGRNFKALCPFHNEKTPSFVVSPERQIAHCFSCNKSADIFGFLMEYEKMEFSEALKFLAGKAGIKLSSQVFKTDKENKKEIIYTLNHLASNFYSYLLLSHPAGKMALNYLTETRKIPTELIKKFNLGYAPSKNNVLVRYLLQKKDQKREDILNSGLASIKNGLLIDFFKNRIIFPIYDVRDNIIAFSGRALNNVDLPKYINTRETLVYKKGDTLYGLNFAKEGIKKEGRAIIVEGEFDVISSFKEGINNAVAVKGTALTINQVKLLKRYTEKISFCFDTDFAGVDAQRRSIQLIEKENILASVIIPPEGKDPDELIKENPLLFKKAIKNDINIYDFIIDSSLKSADKNTAEGKRKILEKTLSFLNLIENEVVKEHYFKKLAQAIDSSLEAITKQAEKTKEVQKNVTFITPKNIKNREEVIEPYFLALILQGQNPKEVFSLSKSILQDISLSLPVYNKIYRIIGEFLQNNEFSLETLVKTLPTELVESFDKCYLLPLPKIEEKEKYLQEIEKLSLEIKNISVKSQLKKISERITQEIDQKNDQELEALRQEYAKWVNLLKIDQKNTKE